MASHDIAQIDIDIKRKSIIYIFVKNERRKLEKTINPLVYFIKNNIRLIYERKKQFHMTSNDQKLTY